MCIYLPCVIAESASNACEACRGRGIGEHVGQRELSVAADTYSHVLMSETEPGYEEVLR